MLVLGGAQSVSELAAAEQVRLPTISRLVSQLEAAGLARRDEHMFDGRRVIVSATQEGERLLQEDRRRRVRHLAAQLEELTAEEVQALGRAADILHAKVIDR